MTQDEIMLSEAMRAEAIAFADWMLQFVREKYKGFASAVIMVNPSKFLDFNEFYEQFKSEQHDRAVHNNP